jgi:hypothetical protein
MERILAERILTVELDGQPSTTLRVVVGWPTMLPEGEYQTLLEFHGPGEGAVLERPIRGGDAWQSVRHAFWLCRDLARGIVNSNARLTYQGDENWSDEMPPLPE